MRSGFDVEQRDIFKFFRESVSFYRNYYDLIVIDTAPALEGNILNRLAIRIADEVISPIDGLEAAFGVKQLLSWINGETRRDSFDERLRNLNERVTKLEKAKKEKITEKTKELLPITEKRRELFPITEK